jgi:hypothetical protein
MHLARLMLQCGAWLAEDLSTGRGNLGRDRIPHRPEEPMNDIAVGDRQEENLDIRGALTRHWTAVAAGLAETAVRIYAEDAVLDEPQEGRLTTGRAALRERFAATGALAGFALRCVLGQDDLWVSDYVAGGQLTVSVMEFQNGLVARETRYVMPAGAARGNAV